MLRAVMHETGGPDVLRIEEAPMPEPGEHELLLEVIGCGICGHDQADRIGLTPIPMPAILGHEVVGRVIGQGRYVRGFRDGDAVAIKQITTCGLCRACRTGNEMSCRNNRHFNYGGYAEYMAVDAGTAIAVDQALAVPGTGVAACAVGSCVHAFANVDLRAGQTVAVTGAGGGLGAHGLQVARAMGARVFAVTSSPAKREQLGKLADEVVFLEGDDGPAWSVITELTGGRGVDVVLDNVGTEEVFRSMYRSVASGGSYVLTGQVARSRISLYAAHVFGGERTITGSSSTRLSDFYRAIDLIGSGSVVPVVEEYPLKEVAKAHLGVDERQVQGRAVLVPKV